MGRALLIAALLIAAGAAGCGPPPYSFEPPGAFKRFERSSEFKYITADGVMLKAREVENYPRAELDFWADALERHLAARGYVLKDEKQFQTNTGLPGWTLGFVLPHGAEDWVLSETLFVVDDRVVLVEVAGPYERFIAVEADLERALLTFLPDGG